MAIYALSATVDHMSPLRNVYAPFEGPYPGMVGQEDCESPFTRLATKRAIAEKYLALNFLSIHQALGPGELDKVYRLPGTGAPADRLTEVRSDIVPLLQILESARFYPGSARPREGRDLEGGTRMCVIW